MFAGRRNSVTPTHLIKKPLPDYSKVQVRFIVPLHVQAAGISRGAALQSKIDHGASTKRSRSAMGDAVSPLPAHSNGKTRGKSKGSTSQRRGTYFGERAALRIERIVRDPLTRRLQDFTRQAKQHRCNAQPVLRLAPSGRRRHERAQRGYLTSGSAGKTLMDRPPHRRQTATCRATPCEPASRRREQVQTPATCFRLMHRFKVQQRGSPRGQRGRARRAPALHAQPLRDAGRGSAPTRPSCARPRPSRARSRRLRRRRDGSRAPQARSLARPKQAAAGRKAPPPHPRGVARSSACTAPSRWLP